jgi:hypothetical protein
MFCCSFADVLFTNGNFLPANERDKEGALDWNVHFCTYVYRTVGFVDFTKYILLTTMELFPLQHCFYRYIKQITHKTTTVSVAWLYMYSVAVGISTFKLLIKKSVFLLNLKYLYSCSSTRTLLYVETHV